MIPSASRQVAARLTIKEREGGDLSAHPRAGNSTACAFSIQIWAVYPASMSVRSMTVGSLALRLCGVPGSM
jgi:hypothetical protein